jgi:hypothetical protein
MFAGRSRGEIACMIGRRLIEIEMSGTGDLINAIYRLASETGIPFWTWKGWWSWQNRTPPKDVLQSTWERLLNAYQLQCTKTIAALQCELGCAKCLARQITEGSCGGNSHTERLDEGERVSASFFVEGQGPQYL